MQTGTKKVLIWSGVGLAVLVIALVVKKSMAVTTVLPLRTQIPGSPVVSGNALNTGLNIVKSLFPSGLPAGFTKASNGQITTASGAKVAVLDPNTGAYMEADQTWYLKNGTALAYYDTTNGVYQEASDHSWYTFDGTSLAYYDPTTGNYVEDANTKVMYNSAGVVINSNVDISSLAN